MEQRKHTKDEADSVVTELNRQVGVRVMDTRKAQRLSRRELSERSGVSPRYLATLEGGDGNISIGLLKKLSNALKTPIDYFLDERDVDARELRQLITLFYKADAQTRARALQLLDPAEKRKEKACRLCLVGLRGAGKSTLGARIGDHFDAPFIELNEEIAKGAGMPVGEIIALYGHDGYRQLEADTLFTLIAAHQRAVFAVAGGLVSEKETFNTVLRRFHTVWVKASSNEHMDRVRAQGDLRPMAGNPQAMTQLKHLLKTREALYAQADYSLDTSHKGVETSVSELSKLIETHQLLNAS